MHDWKKNLWTQDEGRKDKKKETLNEDQPRVSVGIEFPNGVLQTNKKYKRVFHARSFGTTPGPIQKILGPAMEQSDWLISVIAALATSIV